MQPRAAHNGGAFAEAEPHAKKMNGPRHKRVPGQSPGTGKFRLKNIYHSKTWKLIVPFAGLNIRDSQSNNLEIHKI